MKLTTALILGVFTIASTLVSTTALAAERGHDDRRYRDRQRNDHAYARVVHVEPVYRRYSRPVRNTSCLRRAPGRAHPVSYTGTILGAVVGSALGHRIGDARGDPGVAAVAGGLLGASIGRDYDRNAHQNRGWRATGPCRVRRHQETVRELVEYKVTYRYNGRVRHARMDYDPGEWVKLDVDVFPA